MEISFTNGWRTVFPDGGRNQSSGLMRWVDERLCRSQGIDGRSLSTRCQGWVAKGWRDLLRRKRPRQGSHPQLPVGREPSYLTLCLIQKIRLRARQLLNNKAEVQKAAHSW